MRDILEELLAVPDEEEEQGVLEGLLRRMFGAARERGGLERGAETESFPQAVEGSFGVKRIDRIFERDARRYDSQFYLY